jgi:EAL and modified HD-GYP domain-containing signal transduction protein
LQVSLCPATKLDSNLLSQLNGDPDSAAGLSAKLPLLLALESLEQLGDAAIEIPPQLLLYLVLPSALLAAEDSDRYLIPLVARGVKLMAQGSPPPAFAAPIESLACAGDNPAIDTTVLLRKLAGPHLASGIDTYAAHQRHLNAGFHWFSGDWPLHPEEEQGTQTNTSRSTLLNLLGLVVGDADSHEIEGLLKRDPNLSYQLLKLVNSVSFSLSHKISSFGQAITLLGRRQLQRWLQLLIYAGHHADDSVSPLFSLVAMRAALLEALVEARGGKQNDKDRGYMAGMFSLLDILFGAPLDALVTPLNLDDDITQALIAREGTLGRLLEVVIASGGKPSELLTQQLAELGISSSVFVAAQLRASAWSAQICREI